MGKSVLNYICAKAPYCCFSVDLKIGTLIIGLLGLVVSLFYIGLIDEGAFLETYAALSPTAAYIVTYTYTTLGILMLIMNFILLEGTRSYTEPLILTYLWFGAIFFICDSSLIVTILTFAVTGGKYAFALALAVFETSFWLLLYFHVFAVVNGFRQNIHTVVIYMR